jgi:predicted Zn finger-like uncharacterized protein
MTSMRLRRLTADYERLRDFVRRHPRLRLVQVDGDPPELYQLEYRIKSLRQVDDRMTVVKTHLVEIMLPRNYPRTPPQCRMLSPVFHPNIAPHAICVGDHWSAGEPLWSIVARIGEMLAYQSYNTKSPLNGEAAKWVANNVDRLPLDSVNMLVDEPEDLSPSRPKKRRTKPPPPPPPRAKRPAVAKSTKKTTTKNNEEIIIVTCPDCGARYKLSSSLGAKRIRCKKCQTIIKIPQT